MGKQKRNSDWAQTASIARILYATCLALLPTHVLALGCSLENRPAAPLAVNHVVVFDDYGEHRFIGELAEGILLTGGDIAAIWFSPDPSNLVFGLPNGLRTDPDAADDLGGALAYILETPLNTSSRASPIGSHNGHDPATYDARGSVHRFGCQPSGLGSYQKTDRSQATDEEGHDQVEPLHGKPGSSDGVGRSDLSRGEPLGAKIAVFFVLWVLAMGFIPIGIIWLGLARTFKGQAIGAGLTVCACAAAIASFSIFWSN